MRNFMIKEIIKKGSLILKKANITRSKHEARLILSKEIKKDEAYTLIYSSQLISRKKKDFFYKNIYKRLFGKPISRILGFREFYSRDFLIDKNTLDPRSDSESMVNLVLSLIKITPKKKLKILDLGTGTGCLIISILLESKFLKHKKLTGVGVDVSKRALKVAIENKKKHNLKSDLDFYASDWFSCVKGKFDIIISNPPYIKTNEIINLSSEVKNYDPFVSLNGGASGIECYLKIHNEIRKYLYNEGYFCTEIGLGQENQVKKIFNQNGLCFRSNNRDLSGRIRNQVFQLRKNNLKK